jgi:hypothetical protein
MHSEIQASELHSMNGYRSVRVWQLKMGASARELEELVTSGVLEMQRWIPGVKSLSLVRLEGEPHGRYLIITTFTNYEVYRRWRQIEEEGSDYWERYASIMMHWEELAQLLEEYHGEVVSDLAVQYL